MKLSIHQPRRLAWLALLLAAGAMLLSTSGAQAAANRGAVLVKDIIRVAPAAAAARPATAAATCPYVGRAHRRRRHPLLCSADDGIHGKELWRSNGTLAGTRMVKDINPGSGLGTGAGSTAVGGTLYFSATDGVHGGELWRTDGTRAGTRMVKDIDPGSGSGASEMTDVGGTLYFIADDGLHGAELWTSDGTEAGTTMVKEIRAPPDLTDRRRHPLLQRRRRQRLGAVAKRRHRARGRALVKQQFVGSLCVPHRLQPAPSTSRADDGVHGPALWRSDGTEAGHDHGQGRRFRRYLSALLLHRGRRHPLLPLVGRPAPTRMSCGEATAPRRGRPWSLRRINLGGQSASIRAHRRQAATSTSSATSAERLWRTRRHRPERNEARPGSRHSPPGR